MPSCTQFKLWPEFIRIFSMIFIFRIRLRTHTRFFRASTHVASACSAFEAPRLTLTIAFKVWFFAAAWLLARQLSNSTRAFLAVASLIITAGAYGAFGVFHYAEDWLTARSLAEALVITALACLVLRFAILRLADRMRSDVCAPVDGSTGFAVVALPLVIAPTERHWRGGGSLLALGIALAALQQPSIAHFFVIMDADWLEVVRERSQFLFLQLWRAADWSLNALPFLSLTLSALAIDDPRVRRLCTAAMLVGATGLAVALIASLVGPVSLLCKAKPGDGCGLPALRACCFWRQQFRPYGATRNAVRYARS